MTQTVFASHSKALYARPVGGGGGGYCHIWAIQVCAGVKGMVLKQVTLG